MLRLNVFYKTLQSFQLMFFTLPSLHFSPFEWVNCSNLRQFFSFSSEMENRQNTRYGRMQEQRGSERVWKVFIKTNRMPFFILMLVICVSRNIYITFEWFMKIGKLFCFEKIAYQVIRNIYHHHFVNVDCHVFIFRSSHCFTIETF